MKNDIKIVDKKVATDEEITDNMINLDAGQVAYLPSDFQKSVVMPEKSVITSPLDTDILIYNGIAPKPYDVDEIIYYRSLESTYQSALEKRRDSIVGLGYDVQASNVPKPLKEMLKHPNEDSSETFTSIMSNAYDDLQTFYDAFIEIVKVRDRIFMFNIPSEKMFVKPVMVGGKFTRRIESYAYFPNPVADCTQYVKLFPLPYDGNIIDGVHYVIHFKRISRGSFFYGNPETEHLHNLVKQTYLSDQYNTIFFENGAQPSWALLATGASIPKKMQEGIRNFISNKLKGVANAHKMLFLTLKDTKAKVQLLPLTKSIDEQFISLGDKTQIKIAMKLGVPPKMLNINGGGSSFGGGSSELAEIKLFVETVCRPEQTLFAEVLNRALSMFGIDPEISFKKIYISNEKDDAINAKLYFTMRDEYGNRVLDVNEIRKKYLKLDEKVLSTVLLENPEKNMEIKPNSSGDKRTNDNTDTGSSGTQTSPTNLDSEKGTR